ncbi:Spermidine/putrescine import ATP-binding protein PotA [Bacillus sp. THAF10]|uniref:ABC transporter ATP-binding protein n=1 Tax=Bacillus sp. THAF10 TaxID=2587848 RepID=UPI0012696F34|nr:ABC transporter ATP-binding protein [Bacillus sp. THAF10]QFT91144.1 Spermidine/putrescine import ATP-binding protein PotA [Bacillus sp. THAF10]
MSYVQVDSLVKRYDDKTVLDNLSFSIEKGEFVTLLGQSGCGKSTLLRSIAGITGVDAGNIMVNNQDITHLPSRKRGIGMVFQSYALFPNMTVFQNISYGLKMKKEGNVESKVKKMMDMMDLGDLEKRYPHELSGGQQQRVAFARSLIMEPSVLLLDEPFSALDAKIRKSLQEEVKKIQRELDITTIFVTHDQKEAMILSDTIYVMNRGIIEQAGSPEEIYTKPKNKFVASFIGAYNLFSATEWGECTGMVAQQDVAIRPESILLTSSKETLLTNDEQYVLNGQIKRKMLNGNIVSYKVQVDNHSVLVDEINRTASYAEGEDVRLIIPKTACSSL